MLKEFRTFVARGNVLDLAVAVIIGAAFATITTSLTEDLIMQVIGVACPIMPRLKPRARRCSAGASS